MLPYLWSAYFDRAPHILHLNKRQSPQLAGKPEAAVAQLGVGGGNKNETEKEGRKEGLLTLLRLPNMTASSPLQLPPPSCSPSLPSRPGWARESLERRSDVLSTAGYRGLIKGDWRSRRKGTIERRLQEPCLWWKLQTENHFINKNTRYCTSRSQSI